MLSEGTTHPSPTKRVIVLVEDLFEPALLPFPLATIPVEVRSGSGARSRGRRMMSAMVDSYGLHHHRLGGRSYGRGWRLVRTLDQLVEFASVEPDTAALRAVVDFNSLALGHHQVSNSTCRAFHSFLVWICWGWLGLAHMRAKPKAGHKASPPFVDSTWRRSADVQRAKLGHTLFNGRMGHEQLGEAAHAAERIDDRHMGGRRGHRVGRNGIRSSLKLQQRVS